MLIQMIKNEKGSPNGIQVVEYVKGEEYDMPEDLGKVFVKMGAAKMVTVPENKDSGPAPDNKVVEEDVKEESKKKKTKEE